MDDQLTANLQRLLAAFMQHAPPEPPAEITEEEKEVRRLHEESQRQLKIAVQRKEIAENQKKKEEVQRETEAIRREMRQEKRERMRELGRSVAKQEPILEQAAEEPMVQPAQEHHPEVEFLATENKVGIHPLLQHVKPEDEPGPAPPAQEFFDEFDQQLEMFEYAAAEEDQDQEIVMPQFDQQFEDVQDVPREPEFEDQEIVMEDVVDESKSRVEPRQLRSGRVLPGPNADLNFWRKRRGPNSKNAPKNAPKKSKKK